MANRSYSEFGKKSREEKTQHNIVSQKGVLLATVLRPAGRQRINEGIDQLKEMLPECREVTCNKASILQQAVKALEYYQQYAAELQLAWQVRSGLQH